MIKYIHGLCRSCFKVYKNFAKIEIKSKAENMRMFVCPHCVIKNINKDKLCKTQNLLPL